MRTNDLFAFIKERHTIYERRAHGAPKPWTQDPILQRYRFCNVYRELDTVTEWIAKHWRKPHAKDPNLWFAMAVARLVNWPDTLAEMGYPEGDNFLKPNGPFIQAIKARQARGEKTFSGAYIVATQGAFGPKADHLAKNVLGPMWTHQHIVQDVPINQGLQGLSRALSTFSGFAGFLSGQVVADVKYTPTWRKAPDWWTFAISGPGSRRGLARVADMPVDHRWREDDWKNTLNLLAGRLEPLVERIGMPRLHNQDLQNCLCEFDKYERTRLGQGRPRATYPGLHD